MTTTLAVVLHHGDASVTDACVASLAMQDVPLDIVTLAADPTACAPPAGTVVGTGGNVGFAGGMNLALRLAKEQGRDVVLLVTNDTRFAPTTTRMLCDRMHADERLAVVGPALYRGTGAERALWSAGGVLDLERVTVRGRDPDERIDWVGGSTWLVRLAAVDDIGEFDERYFLYWEEVDWCMRATARGWRLAVEPGAEVDELASASTSRVPGLQTYYLTRNRLLLASTHAGRRATARVFVRVAVDALAAMVRHREPHALRAVVDFSRRRFGRNPRYG